MRLKSYDGGIGQGPGLESHGGSTYCAIAALALMDRVDEMAALRPRVLDWCIKRQLGEAHPSWGEAGHAADAAASEDDATNSDDTSDTTIIDDTGGLQGRPNKPADTCYAFWIGATLQLLHATHFLSHRALLFFLRKTETRVYGGFGKDEEALPDALHSYMGLAGWSVVSGGGDEEWAVGLRGLDGALNLTRRHVDRLLQGRGD